MAHFAVDSSRNARNTEQRGHNPKDGLEEQHAVFCEISERADSPDPGNRW